MIHFKTPEIPPWMRTLEHSGYRNIFSFELGNYNLFGTETLCGDWDGDLLIVAQDFAPASFIPARIDAKDPFPYRHEPSFPTNKFLVDLLKRSDRPVAISGEGHLECGALYVSASFLLRDDGKVSGALPDWKHASRHASKVLSFVIERMPKLEKIACLGEPAFNALAEMARFHGTWRQTITAGNPFNFDGKNVYAHSHTGSLCRRNRLPPGSSYADCINTIQADWRQMLR